jgi:hypothetical protein
MRQDLSAIDHIPITDLLFTTFRQVEDIPWKFKSDWAAMRTQLRVKHERATDDEERTRIMLWYWSSHSMFLRKNLKTRGCSRGPSKDSMKIRFQAWRDGNYLLLVKLWGFAAHDTS